MSQWTLAALVLLAAAAVGGCHEEGRRVYSLDKGTYAGPEVPRPPDTAEQGWRERAEKMRF